MNKKVSYTYQYLSRTETSHLEKTSKKSVSNAWVMTDFAENDQQGILADGGTSFKVKTKIGRAGRKGLGTHGSKALWQTYIGEAENLGRDCGKCRRIAPL